MKEKYKKSDKKSTATNSKLDGEDILSPAEVIIQSTRPSINIGFLSPAAPKARDGRYSNNPHPSVSLSVRPSRLVFIF